MNILQVSSCDKKPHEGYLFGSFSHFEDSIYIIITIKRYLFYRFSSVKTKNCIGWADSL